MTYKKSFHLAESKKHKERSETRHKFTSRQENKKIVYRFSLDSIKIFSREKYRMKFSNNKVYGYN